MLLFFYVFSECFVLSLVDLNLYVVIKLVEHSIKRLPRTSYMVVSPNFISIQDENNFYTQYVGLRLISTKSHSWFIILVKFSGRLIIHSSS